MKKKGLRPLIFALIFAMLLTSMNAAPVLAAKKPCNHIYAEFIYGEDGKCIGTYGGKDRMRYTKMSQLKKMGNILWMDLA